MQIDDSDLKAALPDVTSTMKLAGLENEVVIYRDPWGIPHIKADSEPDLFFAQGFATAQDRLWHMDFDRHQALGRWAEFAGVAGVERDKLLRAAGMGRTARLDYACSSAATQTMIDAYAAGVNAFIATTQSLPVEYKILELEPEPWENWHCLAVYKMRNTLLGTFEPKLLRTQLAQAGLAESLARFIRGYPQGHLLTVPPGEVYEGALLDGLDELNKAAAQANWLSETDPGSNAWAISGDFTASGQPLVAGDSHRSLDTPSVYYQVHLACPEFSVIGHSVPGMPGALHFCHSEHVAWGMTYGSADTQDLFVERFREGAGGREYEFRGEWLKAEVLEETIAVRDGEPVALEVTVTHHGPVIAGDPCRGVGLAISDPGLIEGTPWADAARDAMRARSVDELHAAFGKWNDRVNNYAVADVHGNFGYLHEGKIPVRGAANGWRAVPGWSGEYEWQGYIPQKDLPQAINPDVGYAVTCNQKVAAHDYPYYVNLYASPDFRARRVQSGILSLKKGAATVEDMGAIHAECLSLPGRVYAEALGKLTPSDENCARALELLRQWDGRVDRDQVQPTIYAKVRAALVRRVSEHLLGERAAQLWAGAAGGDAHLRLVSLELTRDLKRGSAELLPPGVDWEAALTAALQEAVADLKEQLGGDMAQWQWGRLHHTRPRHPLSALWPHLGEVLDPPALPVHGDGDTPLAGSYEYGNSFVVTGLSVNRYIHDPSNWRKSRWIVPLGASGHPASPHYADQAQLWADVEFVPQLWEWDEIDDAAETVQKLTPG